MVNKDSAEGYVMPANDHDTVSMSMVSWKLQQVSKGSYLSLASATAYKLSTKVLFEYHTIIL